MKLLSIFKSYSIQETYPIRGDSMKHCILFLFLLFNSFCLLIQSKEPIFVSSPFFPLQTICFTHNMMPDNLYEHIITLPPLHGPQYPWKNPTITITKVPVKPQDYLVETPGVYSLPYELDGIVKVFHLVAQPIEHVIVDEKISYIDEFIPKENMIYHEMKHYPKYQKMKCWGFNGSTPGPTIEAYEGDTVRIIVKNELPEPTSVHWHGIEVPNAQDGSAPLTQRPIMPGKSYTYEFTLHQSGTLMYHSGFNITKQEHMGLGGAFIIHPKEYDQKPDKQFAIMLQQWAIVPGSEYPNVMSMDFNWFTFNGRAAPNIPVLRVQQGDRVRIRFANLIMDSHPIHIHGYVWEEVGTEGGPIQPSARRKGSTILVAAGTTRDVEFVAWNPGTWFLHCHKLHHVMNAHAQVPMGIMDHGGMFTFLHVEPTTPSISKSEIHKVKKNEISM